MFRQAEVRRTNADVTRATTELGGLENIESAVEQAGVYPAVVEFEASLQQLAANPVDPSLRAATLAGADTLARKFNIAASSLDAVGTVRDGLDALGRVHFVELGATVGRQGSLLQSLEGKSRLKPTIHSLTRANRSLMPSLYHKWCAHSRLAEPAAAENGVQSPPQLTAGATWMGTSVIPSEAHRSTRRRSCSPASTSAMPQSPPPAPGPGPGTPDATPRSPPGAAPVESSPW